MSRANLKWRFRQIFWIISEPRLSYEKSVMWNICDKPREPEAKCLSFGELSDEVFGALKLKRVEIIRVKTVK